LRPNSNPRAAAIAVAGGFPNGLPNPDVKTIVGSHSSLNIKVTM
jgi:hypothetical protein